MTLFMKQHSLQWASLILNTESQDKASQVIIPRNNLCFTEKTNKNEIIYILKKKQSWQQNAISHIQLGVQNS